MTLLAFSRPTIGPESDWLFGNFHKYGYAGLQLKDKQYEPYMRNPAALARLAHQHPGLTSALISAIPLSPKGMEYLEQLGQFAEAVNCKRLVIHCSNGRRGITGVDDLCKVATALRTRGIAVSLHNHYNEVFATAEDMRAILSRPGADALTFTIDTAHVWAAATDDTGNLIREFHEVIDNIHLKDCSQELGHSGPHVRLAPRGYVRFRRLGLGDMDFSDTFAALKAVRFAGWLCVDEESGDPLETGLAESMAYLRRLGYGLAKD